MWDRSHRTSPSRTGRAPRCFGANTFEVAFAAQSSPILRNNLSHALSARLAHDHIVNARPHGVVNSKHTTRYQNRVTLFGVVDDGKRTKRPEAKLTRPPHATQTVSLALYVKDIQVLDTAIERHIGAGGRANRSDVIRWLINYADQHNLWDELPKHF